MVTDNPAFDTPLFKKIFEFYSLLHDGYSTVPELEDDISWQHCDDKGLSILKLVIRTGDLQDDAKRTHIFQEIGCHVVTIKVLMRLVKEKGIITSELYSRLQDALQALEEIVVG